MYVWDRGNRGAQRAKREVIGEEERQALQERIGR